ncbi:hypothetical protein IF650_00600 [Cellulosimicrobium terreum]|nr:hypothetical protein [Cellulosimicrobium terreum]
MPLRRTVHALRFVVAATIAATLATPVAAPANAVADDPVASALVRTELVTTAAPGMSPMTNSPIRHVEVGSGQEARFYPESVASGGFVPEYGPVGDLAWEYSDDGGKTWTVLPGKHDWFLSITAVTARNGWQVRLRETVGDQVSYSPPAWLRVHSKEIDPYSQMRSGDAFSITSGWAVSALSGSTTSTGVLGSFRLTKRDATALVSDLKATYVDSSGTWYTGTITKKKVAGRVVDVTLSSRTSAGARAARAGDSWMIEDRVTGEVEYYAATTDRPSLRQPPLNIPRPLLDAQFSGGLIRPADRDAVSGSLIHLSLDARNIGGSTVRWEFLPSGSTHWQDLGRTGLSTTLRASTARELSMVRAVILTGEVTQYRNALVTVRSTIADPYLLNELFFLPDNFATSEDPSWNVRTTSSSYDRQAGTATLRGTLTSWWTDTKNLHVYHREANGTWTKASLRTTRIGSDDDFTFTATARPSSAALASTAGDVWRIHDATISSSVEYVRAG